MLERNISSGSDRILGREGGKCAFAASRHEGERTAKADIDLRDFLIVQLGEGFQGSRSSLRLRGHQFVEPDADLQCSPFRSVYFLALMGRLATHKLRCSGIVLCDEFRAIRYTYFRNM